MNIFQKISERPSLARISYKNRLVLKGRKIGPETTPLFNSPTTFAAELKQNKRMQGLGLSLLEMISQNSNTLKAYISINNLHEDIYLTKHSGKVIPKKCRFKKTFDLMMDFLVYYSTISTMFFLGFAEKHDPLMNFDYFVWAMFLIDLILNFFTEYKNKRNKSVMNFKLIAIHYAKTWLVFDVLSLLPFSWADNPNTEYFLRLFRILKMKKLFNKVKILPVATKISDFFYNEENKAKKKFRAVICLLWDLLKELLKMLFVTFGLACLWWYYIKLIGRKRHEPDGFISYFDLENKTKSSQFLITWYYMFTTMMTVGYGDFYAINKYEMGFAIILLIAGPTWIAFTMGKAINIINDLGKIDGKEDKMGLLNIWISNIESKKTMLPLKLKSKINDFFINHWKHDRLGPLTDYPDESCYDLSYISNPLLNQLPKATRDSLMNYLFSDIIYRFNLFFKHFRDIQYELVRFLQPRIFCANSIILDQNMTPHEVFFKLKGTTQIGVNSLGEYAELFVISEIFIIGDYFILQETPSFAQFKAVDNNYGYGISGFIYKQLVEEVPVRLKAYLAFLESLYSRFQTVALEKAERKPLETGEKDECSKNQDIKDNEIISSCVLPKQTLNKEKAKIKEIERIRKGVKRMKSIRKHLLQNLKFKIAEHISEFHLPL